MIDGVRDGLRRAVSTWPRRVLLVGTILLGALNAFLWVPDVPLPDRNVRAFLATGQSLMSILTPLIGIVLVADLRRARSPGGVLPTLLAGLIVAAGISVLGTLACGAVMTALDRVGPYIAAGVLVQCVALLTGTGLGLLIPSRVIAFLATIVIPLGLWRLLGTTEALEPARGWLTQYESARRLLEGEMTPFFWLQFLVMVAIWGVGLNALGAWNLRRRSG